MIAIILCIASGVTEGIAVADPILHFMRMAPAYMEETVGTVDVSEVWRIDADMNADGVDELLLSCPELPRSKQGSEWFVYHLREGSYFYAGVLYDLRTDAMYLGDWNLEVPCPTRLFTYGINNAYTGGIRARCLITEDGAYRMQDEDVLSIDVVERSTDGPILRKFLGQKNTKEILQIDNILSNAPPAKAHVKQLDTSDSPSTEPHRLSLCGATVAPLCQLGSDASSGEAPASLDAEVRAGLDRALSGMATLQRNGGWVTSCTPGHEILWGQDKPVGDDWITLQPPATPSIARVYVRAARALNEERWRAVAAKARMAVAAMQNEYGGFPHEGKPGRPPRGAGTFDDDVTTGCTEFLLEWWQLTGDPEDKALLDQAGGFILAAQYLSSGGWPQAHPPREDGYQKDITFNDGVMRNVLLLLLKLHEVTKDARYLEAAQRGGDCIIRLQGPGEESIWAQQYDRETLEPSWARHFEPPGYTPNESSGICDVLIALLFATRDERFLAPLPRAFRWYDTHRLDNGKYARLYEPGTQRPVYGRRDKPEKVYEFENATGGYGWQGDWNPNRARTWHELIQAEGMDGFMERYAAHRNRIARADEAQVRQALTTLSERGMWESPLTDAEKAEHARLGVDPTLPLVRSRDFVASANTLLDYLEGQ